MNLLVTNAGLAALVNAEATGTETITISEIKFGSGQYTPTKTQTAMQAPFKTLTALSGGAVSANTLHVTAEDASTETYSVYEVGVFLTDGTLFAVGSQNTAILQKASAAIALLSVDIALADHSAATVTVGDTNFFNPQATTEVKGVVELATADETKAGTDDTRAVTPASLKAELDVRDSKVVHTTGDELIYGEKTFTSRPVVKNGGPSLALVQTDIEKGTAPSAPQYSYIDFRDKAWKTLGSVTSVFDAAKASTIRLTAYKASSAEDSETASVELIYPADGSPYAMAPTPADADDSSTKIATTAWVKKKADQYLPLAGGTMTGDIAFAGKSLKSTVDNSVFCMFGSPSAWNAAPLLALYGKELDESNGAGQFMLLAGKEGSTCGLVGTPSGALTWGNKNIVRTVNSVSADAAGNVVITDISGSAGSAGSCTGNAATASKLESKFTIDGVMSDGSVAVLHYAACSTAADTAAKTVTLSNFNLVTGSKLCVRFTVTNTASAPTLNVNGTGAKPIKYRGNAISSAYLEANRIYEFVYDGSGYALVGDVVYVDNVVTNGSSNPV
ncbi:MAG: phage tail protein, partial [Sutterella sp.]